MSSLERFGGDREMRIGNAERASLTEILRSAVDQGYIDLDEYEKRVDTLMAAKTVGETEVVLADLPAYQRVLQAQADAFAPDKQGTPEWIKWLWAGVSIPIGIVTGVWAFVYFLSGSHQYFWPVWVAIPLGVVATVLTIAERTIIRPGEERKRRERLRRNRNQ
ncbi:DUF1707 domain-containing protein [Glycomyces sp. NPDC049804]|uniref:DUF1707 SHOCT-like domain-containing protein n=1 Tax=Glycomyces sp. NPDC049804 TaxID=3154363 RepID=UPI00342D2951